MSALEVLSPTINFEFFFKTVDEDDISFDIIENLSKVTAETEATTLLKENVTTKLSPNRFNEEDHNNLQASTAEYINDRNNNELEEMLSKNYKEDNAKELNGDTLKRLQVLADKANFIREREKDTFRENCPNDSVTLDVIQLDDEDLKKIQSISNRDEIITESDEETLVKNLSNDSIDLDLKRLSEVDLRNFGENEDDDHHKNTEDTDAEGEIISENEEGEIVRKFTRAGRRDSCLIRADSKSDLYTENGTTVNVDLIQPEYKPITPLSGMVDVVRLTKLIGKYNRNFVMLTAADPEFPIGGADPVGDMPSPEAAAFQKFCMSKRKNWVCSGGASRSTTA